MAINLYSFLPLQGPSNLWSDQPSRQFVSWSNLACLVNWRQVKGQTIFCYDLSDQLEEEVPRLLLDNRDTIQITLITQMTLIILTLSLPLTHCHNPFMSRARIFTSFVNTRLQPIDLMKIKRLWRGNSTDWCCYLGTLYIIIVLCNLMGHLGDDTS